MKNDYSKSISMQCPTCGGESFEFENEDGPVKCVGCDRFFTRDELKNENGARIDSEVDGIKDEFMKSVRKDFKNLFKK